MCMNGLRVDIFGLGWISSEVCKIPEVETHNAWINRLAKRRLQKNGMTSFLVSYQRNQS